MRERHFLLIATLIGYGLRILMLDRFPFREDEAIYSYWALHGWYEDPLFLTIWPDKPPIFIWLLGVAYQLFGIEAASARMVSVMASTLTIPVVGAIARRLWSEQAALVAAIVLAFSPFAISFAPTAFVDSVLVLFGCLALYFAIDSRPLAAGLFLGAAIMTKQQGMLYIPLVLLSLVAIPSLEIANQSSVDRQVQKGQFWRRLAIATVGLLVIVLPIVFWDSRRWAIAPSPWDLSVRNYAALTLLAPTSWLTRLREWQSLLWHLTASNSIWLVGLALACLVAIVGIGHKHGGYVTASRLAGSQKYAIAILASWSIGFVLFHVITSVQIWDRYLLPLAPMVALLFGWSVARVSPFVRHSAQRTGKAFPGFDRWRASRRRQHAINATMIFALALLLAMPAWQAATGRLPIGGDHGDYDGLDNAVDWLETEEKKGEKVVLYHDVLGWHYRFYLYEILRQGSVDLRWFPSSTYLADNAEKAPHLRKFYIAPSWAAHADLTQRMKMKNLSLIPHTTYGQFTVYEIGRARVSSCDWCLCANKASASGWRMAPLAGPLTDVGLASVPPLPEPAP